MDKVYIKHLKYEKWKNMLKSINLLMWINCLILSLNLAGCASSQEIASGTTEVKVDEQEKNVVSSTFTDKYQCSCPSGNMPPPLRPVVDKNLYFKAVSTQSETSTIKGKVVDETGLPVPFAIISLHNTTIASMTDEDGQYLLTGIPNGPIQLTVKSDNHCGCILPQFTIEAPQLFKAATIHLQIVRVEVLKPIIYLYPETEQEVTVKLNYAGEITHSYPTYIDEWKVFAKPDGTLIDTNGRQYYALFWEGTPDKRLSIPNGFVVKGTAVIPFLEDKLNQLGLNEREANEFILFWYPKLEANAYNLIHFSFDEYVASAKLDIDPAPETVIRVMMVYQPSNSPVDIPLQVLPERPERKGFTVVEWGGSEHKSLGD